MCSLEEIYSIKLSKIIKEMQLTQVYLPENADNIEVTSPDVERPGLALTGFFENYERTRIQIFGRAEVSYLEGLNESERRIHLENFMRLEPVAVIFSSDLPVFDDVLRYAEQCKVPILSSSRRTSALLAAIIAYLHVELAPRITRHGVLVEVYGEGLLLLGDSGVGKSETAI